MASDNDQTWRIPKPRIMPTAKERVRRLVNTRDDGMHHWHVCLFGGSVGGQLVRNMLERLDRPIKPWFRPCYSTLP